jgi:hypothetical protein
MLPPRLPFHQKKSLEPKPARRRNPSPAPSRGAPDHSDRRGDRRRGAFLAPELWAHAEKGVHGALAVGRHELRLKRVPLKSRPRILKG